MAFTTRGSGSRLAICGRSLSSTLASVVLCGGIGLAGPQHDACAQVAEARGRAFDAGEPAVAPVRLNFFNQTWPEVLGKLAESSGSTLVMDVAPSGRFTRFDRKTYSRGEAVQILNRELEPQGFRILEKGDHLVVFNLRDMRSEYRRPVLPIAQEHSGGARQAAQPDTLHRAGYEVWQDNRPSFASRPVGPASAERAAEQSAARQPVRDTRDARSPGPGSSAPEDSFRPHVSETSAAGQSVTLRVPLQKQPAVEVARTIYNAFKGDADLLDRGPGGLPAFRVRRPAAAGAPRPVHLLGAKPASVDYAVGIDADNDELVVEAPEPRARQIEQLILTVDRTPVGRGDSLAFISAAGDSRKLAQQLQVVANQALAQRPQQPARQGQRPGQPQQPQQPQDGQQPEGEQPEAEQPAAPGTGLPTPIQLELQGPVTVREVPGVGLVVTGNREDVEAVLNVIKVLELAGAGVTPDIHLLMLRHVNSEALAELLNSVYEELSEIRSPLAGQQQQQTVRVVPVVKPNAVLILAPTREMESVLELAEALDQPVDPDVEVEAFRLNHAIATDVVAAIDAFYEDRPPLGTRVRALADVRTNAVIVHARPRDLEEVARLVRKLDVGHSNAVNRMRIFPLQNATATDLANIINAAIYSVIRPPSTTGQQGQFGQVAQAGEQIPEELRTAKSAILEFLASDGATERLVRSGILADIRVTADPSRNALIVTAPELSMDLMAALIQQLDQPTPLVAEIKVFTLANSDATAIVQLLQSLFQGQTQQQPGQPGAFGQPGAAGGFQGGLQLAGAEGAGAGLIPLRFSVDPRTNTIIAIGAADALQIVEAVLLRLDESDIRQRQNTVIKLKNVPANDVAIAINQFLTAQRDLAQVDPNLVTNLELLEREIIVVPELVSNSLLISATPRYFQEIINLVVQLDQKPPEVVIQALLVEVDLDNTDEFGVQLGFQDSVLFDRSVMGVPGFGFNNAPLGNNTAVSPSTIGTQGLSSFGLNRTNPELGFGGLVLAASSESVSVLIRALSAKRTVHVLTRPTIRTLDNQLAQIFVGQQVPIPTGVQTAGFGTSVSPQVTPQQVGITLSVIPRISPDGTIVMEVLAQKGSLSATRVPIFTDIETGNTVESPVINLTQAEASISVPNGQTVVLGGMITKTDDAFERKVPWLGDIPYLGLAFRSDGVRTRRTELLMFLTPRIIRHESDSELIKRVESERLHFIERDAEELHGPLYSAPPVEWYMQQGAASGYSDPSTFCPPGFDDGSLPTTVMPPLMQPLITDPIPLRPVEPAIPGMMMEPGRAQLAPGQQLLQQPTAPPSTPYLPTPPPAPPVPQ